MARIKIELPGTFHFTCSIPVRITDLNYGGHAGNDTILSLVHESRMQYLRHIGFTEMQFGGCGMIMADATVEFKAELFYGDIVEIAVGAGEISKIGFDLFYRLEKDISGKKILVATVKTGMICFDYGNKKIVPVPEEAKSRLI